MRFVMLEITDNSLSDGEAIQMVSDALSEHKFGIQLSVEQDHLIELDYQTFTENHPRIIGRTRVLDCAESDNYGVPTDPPIIPDSF